MNMKYAITKFCANWHTAGLRNSLLLFKNVERGEAGAAAAATAAAAVYTINAHTKGVAKSDWESTIKNIIYIYMYMCARNKGIRNRSTSPGRASKNRC